MAWWQGLAVAGMAPLVAVLGAPAQRVLPAPMIAGPPSDWVFEGRDKDRFQFLRTAGTINAAGYRPLERLEFFPVRVYDGPPMVRAPIIPLDATFTDSFYIKRTGLAVNCDLLTVKTTGYEQMVNPDGSDGQRFDYSDPFGNSGSWASLIDDGPTGQLILGMACGFGGPSGRPARRFTTTAAAIGYAKDRQKDGGPTTLPPPRDPKDLAFPARSEPWPATMGWTGDYYLAVRGPNAQGVLLDRASLRRNGRFVKVRVLTVLVGFYSSDAGMAARDVTFDCVAGTETVSRVWRWGERERQLWTSARRFTRPVKDLLATSAAMALACGDDDWSKTARRVDGGVWEAVVFVQDGGISPPPVRRTRPAVRPAPPVL